MNATARDFWKRHAEGLQYFELRRLIESVKDGVQSGEVTDLDYLDILTAEQRERDSGRIVVSR